MSQLRRPVYSQEDLLDLNLARLPYKGLQAIAVSMHIPANIKRIDMVCLIKAVRDGQMNIVHEYNRFRAENPYMPWIVTYPSNPEYHNHEFNQVAEEFIPMNYHTVQTHLNSMHAHRAPRHEPEYPSTSTTQYVRGSLLQEQQVLSQMSYFQPGYGWMERSFVQTLWSPMDHYETPVYVPVHQSLPQQEIVQRPYISMENDKNGTPKISKEITPSDSSGITENNGRDFATQEIDGGLGALLIDEDVILELDLNVERKRNCGNAGDSLKKANNYLKSDSQNGIQNDDNRSQHPLTTIEGTSSTGHSSSDDVNQSEEDLSKASTNNTYGPVGSKILHKAHQNLLATTLYRNTQTIYTSQQTKYKLFTQQQNKRENHSNGHPEVATKLLIPFSNGRINKEYSASSKQGISRNQWNSNERKEVKWNYGVKVNQPHKITCCPCIGCKVLLPSYNLAQHVLQAHENKVRCTSDVEVRITLSDLQKSKKLLHVQHVFNRIFVTTIEYLDGLLYVAVQHLPDRSNKKSTAIIRIKKQNDNIRKWEGYVQIYDDLKFQSQNFCLMLNVNNYCESEELGIRTMIF